MQPLVSCLMPTYNRREFVARAIRNFQQQTYPNLELIVLDDGTDRIADLIRAAGDDRIKYHEASPDEPRGNHGEKMNIACAFSDGDFGIVWDDDDVYAPDRVERQIAPLLSGENTVSGTSAIFYYKHGTKDAYLYENLHVPTNWIGAIAFNWLEWEKHPFNEATFGADSAFLAKIPREKWIDLRDPALLVAAVHDNNAAPKLIQRFTPVNWDSLPEYFRDGS